MDSTITRSVFSILLSVACLSIGRAEELSSRDMPFDRQRINRYSLDHLPRSISIRQGKDVWLGYDLARAKLYKLWRAPQGESGLNQSGFVMRSIGETQFEDKSDETWKLRRGGEIMPLSIRYLGCSEREGHFELRWGLTHGADVMTLRERVPTTARTLRPSGAIRRRRLTVGPRSVNWQPASRSRCWPMRSICGIRSKIPTPCWLRAICRNDRGNYHFTASSDAREWSVGRELPVVSNGANSKPTFDKFGGVYYLGWQEATRIQNANRSVFHVDISASKKPT